MKSSLQALNPKHQRFLALYEPVKDSLYNYLSYRVNDSSVAEDLMMDVTLKAFRHFDSFNEKKASFKTWMFTLARNHLMNHLRDAGKREMRSLESMNEIASGDKLNDLPSELNREMQSEMNEAIFRLMESEEVELIHLRYMQEMNYKEMAVIFSKNEAAMRKKVSRALQRFGDLYTKFYGAHDG
jgi:RNA polymerase sigma-70 factor (ECF subfamily)